MRVDHVEGVFVVYIVKGVTGVPKDNQRCLNRATRIIKRRRIGTKNIGKKLKPLFYELD